MSNNSIYLKKVQLLHTLIFRDIQNITDICSQTSVQTCPTAPVNSADLYKRINYLAATVSNWKLSVLTNHHLWVTEQTLMPKTPCARWLTYTNNQLSGKPTERQALLHDVQHKINKLCDFLTFHYFVCSPSKAAIRTIWKICLLKVIVNLWVLWFVLPTKNIVN